MAETRQCSHCGSELPADAPLGLCPKCVMQVGVESQRPTEDSPAGSQGSHATGAYVPPAPADLVPLFPQLEILELLGQGGMGAVYKARQPGLDRLVALKILPPGMGADPAFAERFTREARSLARLSHPNIVAVYDFGQAGDLYYFIMEYIDGVNLRQMERAQRLDPRQALDIVIKVCEALQYAHDEGIVHRDIKPENILIDKKGRVKIADFGLAKLLGRAPTDFTLTRPEQRMGTPAYMAPEQVERPGIVDHRADIYSLGVVFYEMLTGELPLGRFQAPSQMVHVDVRLDEVVLKALEKEPARRYQHASEVMTDVESIAVSVRGAPRESRSSESLEFPGQIKPTPGRSVIEAVGDSLIVVAGIALATAIGVAAWLSLTQDHQVAGPSNWQRLLRPQLLLMAATLAAYALFILAAGIQMRRLRGRLYALLCNVIVGLFLPAALSLNVILEHDLLRLIWLVLVPVWMGMPVCLWAVLVLYRRDVRAAFAAARRQRALEKEPPSPDQPGSAQGGLPPQAAAQPPGKGRQTRTAWIVAIVAAVIVGGLLLLLAVPIVGGLVVLLLSPRLNTGPAEPPGPEGSPIEWSVPATETPAHEPAWPLVSQWQRDSAGKVGVPVAKELDLGGGVTMKMVLIPAGFFLMGSPDSEQGHIKEEGPQHEVTLSRPFYLGVTEVTQAQYQAVMGVNRSQFKGATNPVEMVSWYDATEFCKKLSEETGQAVRLPTEAELEYACRAGTATAFSFGDDDGALRDYAWYAANSGDRPRPVGQKKPNAWGLYDMHGNLWEWCADWYGEYPKGAVTDPQGPASGKVRVLRCGGYFFNPKGCRSASRYFYLPDDRGTNFGFRVVVSVPGSPAAAAPAADE